MLQSHGGPDPMLRRGGAARLAPDAERYCYVAAGGGEGHPHLRHKTVDSHIQDLHYPHLWFSVAG